MTRGRIPGGRSPRRARPSAPACFEPWRRGPSDPAQHREPGLVAHTSCRGNAYMGNAAREGASARSDWGPKQMRTCAPWHGRCPQPEWHASHAWSHAHDRGRAPDKEPMEATNALDDHGSALPDVAHWDGLELHPGWVHPSLASSGDCFRTDPRHSGTTARLGAAGGAARERAAPHRRLLFLSAIPFTFKGGKIGDPDGQLCG